MFVIYRVEKKMNSYSIPHSLRSYVSELKFNKDTFEVVMDDMKTKQYKNKAKADADAVRVNELDKNYNYFVESI